MVVMKITIFKVAYLSFSLQEIYGTSAVKSFTGACLEQYLLPGILTDLIEQYKTHFIHPLFCLIII